MTPAARIKAVLEILDNIEKSPVPMDVCVGDYMRGRRYIGSKDRAAIVEMVYDMIRHKARIEWVLEQIKAMVTNRHKVLVWLVQGHERSVKDIGKLFDGSKYGPKELSADEEQILSKLDELPFRSFASSGIPEYMACECPAEYEEQLRAVFQDDFAVEMQAMLVPATLDIRVNVNLLERENVKASLLKDRVDVEDTLYSPWGLRAKTKAYLSKTKAFSKGWIDIQDEGSQLIAYLCGAQPGMQVLDYCAGAGGKTLALANDMKGKGRIVAMDVDSRRLDKARPRLKKARALDNVEIRPLTDEKNKKWLRRQKESFDIVLVDVPCSGTGTWRRNPDMRWRRHGPELSELLTVQAEILDRVAKVVKPGGRLVYATCSLLREENEKQIENFLKREPEFKILPLEEIWPSGTPCPAFQYGKNGSMRLSPHQHGTDGFFATVLCKTSG